MRGEVTWGILFSEWYETKKNVDEMVHWEKPKLKKWELAVTEFFPAEAKILDVGCGLGREAFVLSDMGIRLRELTFLRKLLIRSCRSLFKKGMIFLLACMMDISYLLKRILLTSLSYGRRPLVYYMAMNTSMNSYWNVSVF